MKVQTIVNDIMKGQNKTKAELGRAVGIDEKKASDLIAKRLKQDNISVNVVLEMLNAMGYTMIVAPTGTTVKGGMEVTLHE